MRPLHRALFIVVALCFVIGCSTLWTALGAAGGAAAGMPLGPPGMIGGAGVGGALAKSMSENEELRDGELLGQKAVEKIYVDKPIDRIVNIVRIPWWAWALLLWNIGIPLAKLMFGDGRYARHLADTFRYLRKGRIPSATKSLWRAGGAKHTQHESLDPIV